MSKKITSFLVLLAAVLLTVPTQAQTTFNAQKAKAGSAQVIKGKKALKATDLQKAKEAKAFQVAKAKKEAEAKVQGVAFRAQNAVSIEDAQALKAADKSVGKIFAQWDWAAHQAKYFNKKNLAQSSFKNRFSDFTLRKYNPFEGKSVKVGNVAGPRRAVTADEHGIITDPGEGETKFYTRAGTAFYLAGGSAYTEDQSGTVTILEAEGGKVYIKDPVSHYSQGTWVEGTKDGNTITVAAGQPLAWNTTYYATLSLNWGNKNGNSFTRGEGDITFTVDDASGTITLDGSSTDKIIAVFWDDDNSWSGYGDYNTIWTYDPGYEPASTDPIVLPDGAEIQNWYADGTGSTAVPTDVKVAFVGNEVYISGLTSNFPDAWIKGTLDGTTVTFSKLQFVGMYSATMPVWAVGADSETGALQDFTMTFDSEAQTLTLDENQLIVFNAKEDVMYYLSYIESLTIYAEEPAPAQIDVLPYVNSFDTAADQKQFNIIDANEDGRTFAWYNGMARYTYSGTNQADDWLVSPAIKLVAGKKYHFSIAAHAQSSGYPERIEVKAAQENTAEALAAGTEVLPSTDVTTAGFVTFENNEFTVAEDGYYYIGVHAISDADEWYLYVDDFLLEAAPITAPYVADFTTEAPFGDFSVIDNNEDGKTWTWSSSNYANYTYNSSLAADDYLILPIQLEAGKNYDVTVNAANSSYPEKFEVKVGKEGTVEGLSTVAIAETEVTSTDFTDFSGSFTTDEAGTYYVAIHATSDADQFRLKVKTLTIEVGAANTAPAAVSNFTATAVEDELAVNVAFTAPTKTIAGGDLAAITKIEVLRDNQIVKTFEAPALGAALNYKDEGLTAGTHKYQVIPYNEDGIGEKSEELSVKVAAAVSVPYTFDLTQNLTDLFTIIDNNNDQSTWTYSSSLGTYYAYNSSNKADDYLISLPINLVAGKNYNVTVNARAYSSSYAEKFEVKVGKEATVEALNQTVIAETELTSDQDEDIEGQFSVTENGKYYVAIHATSEPNMWNLIVNSLTIEVGAEPTAPAAAADFTATPGAEGALEANLTFTAPATAINGTTLTGTEDIKIYRDNALIHTLTGVAVGTSQNWKDTNVENGKTYTYYIVASNASGDGLKSEKAKVFVGVDELGSVQNFAAAGSTATTITFTWDAVEGINGGYVDAANVTYGIYTLKIETDPNWGFQYLVADEKLGEVTGQTTTTVNFPVDEGELNYQYFGISVKNATTEESDPGEAYTYVVVGEPEALPIEEGFAGKSFHYAWNYSDNADLLVSEDATDGDGVALNIVSYTSDEDEAIWLEKVNLKGAANPTIIFDVKSADITSVDVIGSADGADFTVIASKPINSEYTTVKVPLSSIVGTRFSKVGISAHFADATVIDPWYGTIEELGSVLTIDNIRVVDLYEYDLSIALSAPANVKAGEKATVKATVTNVGENAANGYQVIIKAGDKELFNKTVNSSLASYEKAEYTADYETTIFDSSADVTISAEVIYANDLNPDNNAAETVVSVKESSVAQPQNVTAVQNASDKSVDVNWTAPGNSTTEVTEDFSAYENGADEDGELGEWTLVNANGKTKGGIFQDTPIASEGLVRAWQVFNLATYGGDNTVFAGPDGEVDNNYLISVYNLENQNYPGNDDWLISPVLPGVAQTLTFDVKAFNDYGPQTYQVLYSTTDANIESFQLIEEVADNGGAWSNVSYNLPIGTKYFAIRNVTGGDPGFILAVDNIVYLAGGGSVESYNIYLDGEKIASVEGDKTTYNVTEDKFTDGEHTFAVSAVIGGNESKPVEVTISVVTGISQITDGNKTFDVYTLDGKLVRQQTKSIEGLKGVYVINGKAVMVK